MESEKFLSFNIAEQTLKKSPEIKESKAKLGPEEVGNLAEELAELSVEQSELGLHSYLETGLTKAERKKLASEKLSEAEQKLLESKKLLFDEGAQKQREERLGQIEKIIKDIVTYPQVVDFYREEFLTRVKTIEIARKIEGLERELEDIDIREDILKLKRKEQNLNYSSVDKKFFELNKKRKEEIEKEIQQFEAYPGADKERYRRRLLRYKQEFDKYKFVETPSVKDLVKRVFPLVCEGKPMVFVGESGSGKTEFVKYLCRRYLGADPEYFRCFPDSNKYDLVGTKKLKAGETSPEYGPLPRAWEKKVPLLVDELDQAPQDFWAYFQEILGLKPGDKTMLEGFEEKFIVPKNASIIGTANLKSSRYKERFELDPALQRKIEEKGGFILMNYLDLGKKDEEGGFAAPETMDIVLAPLIDKKGNLDMNKKDFEDLTNFVKAVRFIQEVATGTKTDFFGEGSVASKGKSSTLTVGWSVGMILSITSEWKKDNFERPLEDYILETMARISQRPAEDRLNILKIFCLHGFFTNRNMEEFNIPGLTKEKLDTWRGESTQTPSGTAQTSGSPGGR